METADIPDKRTKQFVYGVRHQNVAIKDDDHESVGIVASIVILLLRSLTYRFANPCESGLHVTM